MTEISAKDLEDTARAAGIALPEPERRIVRKGAEHDRDLEDTLKAAGITLDASSPARKQPVPDEPPPGPPALGTAAEKKAQELSRTAVGPMSTIGEGMPIVGAVPRLAAAATGAAGVGDTMPGGSFGERFNKNREVLKRAQELYDERYPGGSAAGNVMGGAAAAGPLGMTRLGRIAMGAEGPTLGSRLVTGLAGGGGIAATDAALRGDKVLPATIIGAGGGGLGPLTGEIARGGASMAANQLWPRRGPLRDVNPINISRLTSALEGETPASLAEAKRRMGPAGFFGDLNTATSDLAGGVADTPGPGKATVREAYRQRAREQPARIDKALTAAMGPDTDIEAFKDFTTEARKAAVDPLYEQWRKTEIHPTDKLKELMPRLQKAGAFDMAEELSHITGEPINKAFFTSGTEKSFPTAQSWDYVKRGLDRRIDQAYSASDKTLARALIDLKHDMLREIEATPQGKVWKQARQEFASRSAILDQIAAGRDTFLGSRSGLSKDELRHELKGLAGPELAARIQGARSAATEVMGETTRGDTTLRNKILAPNNQDKMRMLLGKNKADALIETMEQEKFLGNQRQDVSGGSQTTPKKERVNALQPPPGSEWNPNLAQPLSFIPPSWLEQLRPGHIAAAWRGQKYGEAANQLAPIVTTQAGPSMDELVKAIYAEGQRRGAISAGGARLGNALSSVVAVPASTTARRRYERQ